MCLLLNLLYIDIDIGQSITVAVRGRRTNYYALPFILGGITLRVDVSEGYFHCYASDTIRNPSPGNHVWTIYTGNYANVFIDPAQFGRSGSRYIYVALEAYTVLNYNNVHSSCQLSSISGNFSSQGE